MVLTNAEKQARYRKKRELIEKRISSISDLDKVVLQLRKELRNLDVCLQNCFKLLKGD